MNDAKRVQQLALGLVAFFSRAFLLDEVIMLGSWITDHRLLGNCTASQPELGCVTEGERGKTWLRVARKAKGCLVCRTIQSRAVGLEEVESQLSGGQMMWGHLRCLLHTCSPPPTATLAFFFWMRIIEISAYYFHLGLSHHHFS
jgi:hypothetical protein